MKRNWSLYNKHFLNIVTNYVSPGLFTCGDSVYTHVVYTLSLFTVWVKPRFRELESYVGAEGEVGS